MPFNQTLSTDPQPNNLPRRTFLGGAAGVAAGAIALKTARAARSDDKPYRVAVIGHTGKGGYGHHLDTVWLDVSETEIVAVADANPEGLGDAVKRLNNPAGYLDYRKMLDETKPDLVSIALGNIDQHCDMTVAAAESGARGIYMEKPLCRTLEEADRMVAACEKHGVKLATAHTYRYVPKLPVVREIIQSGKLGRVLEFRARGKEDHRGGSIDLWVLGTHMLDLMNHLGGGPAACFGTVLQEGRPVTSGDVHEAPQYGIGPLAGDEVHATYRLGGGATGYFDSIRGAGTKPPWRFGLWIFGTEGLLYIRPGQQPFLMPTYFSDDPLWFPESSGKQWIPVTSAGIGNPEPLEGGHLHDANVRAADDLIDAIEQDRQPLSNVYESRTTLEMIVAVFESHRLASQVSIPLQNRQNPMAMLD